MRGKVSNLPLKSYNVGITPAYAGKSYRKKFSQMIRKDHPRLCGEKYFNFTKKGYSQGSPPPMRGKVLRGSMIRRMSGITPAYAGKRLMV